MFPNGSDHQIDFPRIPNPAEATAPSKQARELPCHATQPSHQRSDLTSPSCRKWQHSCTTQHSNTSHRHIHHVSNEATVKMANDRGQRSRRPLYAPPTSTRQQGTLGYWVPLITISTIAIGGLAAWIWSERSDSEEDDRPHNDRPPRPATGQGGAYPTQGSQPYPGPDLRLARSRA